MIVNEVSQHALRINHKQSLTQLSLMDILASFEEVMQKSYPTMSKEVSQRVYKRLTTNMRPQANSSLTQRQSSLHSTINQDLQFDFQGSFAAVGSELGRNQLQSSLNSEDLKPQRLIQSKHKTSFPRLKLLVSSSKQSDDTFTPQMKSVETLHLLQSSASQSKIQLPKISFNDLFHEKRDSILIVEEENPFRQNQQMLYAEHMLGSSNTQQSSGSVTGRMQFPKVQLISELGSTVESRISQKEYFPVRNSKSAERFQKPNAYPKVKENIIDSDQILAETFNNKKLLLKAWKSLLISRMHSIHKAHANKLSDAYYTRRLLHKYLQILKIYIKRIVPEQRDRDQAEYHYRRTLCFKVLAVLRERALRRRELKEKLFSTLIVLSKSRLHRYFQLFKLGISHAQLTTLRIHHARLQSATRLKNKTLRAFAMFMMASKRRTELDKAVGYFRGQSLTSKSLLSFKLMLEFTKRKKLQLRQALSKYDHYQESLRSKSFLSLKHYALAHVRTRQAFSHYRTRLLFTHFKSLKIFTMVRAASRRQWVQVGKIWRQRLGQRVVEAWRVEVMRGREDGVMARMWRERLVMRKVLRRGLVRNVRQNSIKYPPTNGPFIFFAELLLRASFSQVMSQVWQEFPKQKLTQSSPGHPNLLLNYIGLSRTPKYRQYFYVANIVLRKWVMGKAFKGMKKWCMAIKTFRKKREDEIKRLCLAWMYRIGIKQNMLKDILYTKEDRRNIDRLQKAFYAFQLQLSRQRSFYGTLKLRRHHILKRSLTQWHKKHVNLQKEKAQDQLSTALYRQRHLSKYLVIWLHELHHSLKSKHLETLCTPFLQRKRRGYFTVWVNALRKQRYLSEQERQIDAHQMNLTLYRCFQGLKSFTQARRQIKRCELAAKLEYRYWLAKRALMYIKQGISSARAKTSLLLQISAEFDRKLMEKVYECMTVYRRYRQEKRIRDFLMERGIAQIRKRRYVKEWRGVIGRREGAKMLANAMQRIEISAVIRKIQQVFELQEACVDHMRTKSEVFYRVYKPFKSLQRHCQRKKQLKQLQQVVSNSHMRTLKSKNLSHWRSLHSSSRRLYITYAFLILTLKNRFLSPILQAWRTHTRHLQLKRHAHHYSLLKLKRRIFQGLHLHALHSQSLCEGYDRVKREVRRKRLCEAWGEWRREWREARRAEEKRRELGRARVREVVRRWRQWTEGRREDKRREKERAERLNEKRKEIAVRGMIMRCRGRNERSAELSRASQWHQQEMFRKAYAAWVLYYKQNQSLIKRYLHLRSLHATSTKQHLVKLWLRRSDPTLTKMKAVRFMLKLRQKKLLRTRFQTWVNEVNFFISLDHKIVQFQSKYAKRDKMTKIQKLRTFAQRSRLEKQRKQGVREYAERQVQSKVLKVFRGYARHRQQRKELTGLARQHYLQTLMKVTYYMFTKAVTKEIMLNQAAQYLQLAMRFRHSKTFLSNLKSNKSLRRQYSLLHSFAQDFLRQTLATKAIRALLAWAQTQRERRKLVYQARCRGRERLKAKAWAIMALYTQYKVEVKLKRQAMKEVVERVDQEQRLTKAVTALKQHCCNSKRDSQESIATQAKRRLHKLFLAVAFHSKVRTVNRSSYYQVRMNQEHKIIYSAYQLWRKHFINESILRNHTQLKNYRMKANVFSHLAYLLNLRIRENLSRSRGQTRVTLIAFKSLLSHLTARKQRDYNLTQAHLVYLHRLCKSVFRAFSVLKSRKRLLQQALSQRKQRYHLKVLRALSHRVECKHAYYWLLTKRMGARRDSCLRAWLELYQYRVDRRIKMAQAGAKVHLKSLAIAFQRWKKQAYFEKVLELIYAFRYREEEKAAVKGCYKEWARYIRHKKLNPEKKEVLESSHRERVLRKEAQKWKQACRERLFGIKLQQVVESRYRGAFEKIEGRAKVNDQAHKIGSQISSQRNHQIKSDFLQMWRFARVQHMKLRIVTETHAYNLKQSSLKALAHHRMNILEQKYHMLKIISHFSERRPALLLAFSKTFLHLTTQNSTQQLRLCSTVLAKYVLEKWKNVRPLLRSKTVKLQQAHRLYCFNVMRKAVKGWREGSEVIAHKRSLNLSCYEFYNVSMLKRVVQALEANAKMGQKKRTLQNIQLQYEQQRKYEDLSVNFEKWRKKYIKIQKFKSFEWEIKAKYNHDTLYKTFYALKNNAVKRTSSTLKYEQAYYQVQNLLRKRYLQSMLRAFNDSVLERSKIADMAKVAEEYHNTRVQQRVFTMLRQSVHEVKNRGRYSRMMNVFVAWKCWVKERKLLNKYLSECNYQQPASQKYRSQSGKSGRNEVAPSHHHFTSGPALQQPIAPLDIRGPRGSVQLTYSTNEGAFGQGKSITRKQRALVDLDWQALSRRSSVHNNFSHEPHKVSQLTPTLGQPITFQVKDRSGGSLITDENYNSINSPQSSLSPSRQNSNMVQSSSSFTQAPNHHNTRYSQVYNN